MPKEDLVEIDEKHVEEATRDFSMLLDQIDSLGDKKKSLWREIFRNAMQDRLNAFLLFRELYDLVYDDNNNALDSSEMAVHAKALSSLMERQSKTTDQLLKLAALVAEEEIRSNTIDANDVYNTLDKDNREKYQR